MLGPVTAWTAAGDPIALKGPRHRAVLARLIVARGRVVPVGHLVDDLWPVPPEGAISAVRTFVAALRRALEPDRAPRTPPALLVTEGPGYALRAAADAVDAWRFERLSTAPEHLEQALGLWRGPAYADFPDEPWAVAERARLTELRLRAVELLAEARIEGGDHARAVADLDAHVTEHPWREEAWRLLALALYRADRQGDALAVLRRAREQLADRLGLDPGPALGRLESDILRRAEHLVPAAASVWASAAADYDRIVAASARARLDSTVGLLRGLAVTGGGGLEAARRHRTAAIEAAEQLGDPALTARVIGAYDVPASWPRSDDPAQARAVVGAAVRTLAALPAGASAARARLLATIALETRGERDPDALDSAREAVATARRLDDPALLAFALNGLFMQSCHRCGLAPERDAIGAELTALAGRHGLVTYEVLGRLIRMQARSALGDFRGADEHAAAADRLGAAHELPLVAVLTQWYRAMCEGAEPAFRAAAARLAGAGMPGVEHGLLALALLCLGEPDPTLDFGPYEPWARPLLLLGDGRTAEARRALRDVPEPPADLLCEALWCLVARAARALGDGQALRRARAALEPAAGQIAGAGSGMLTAGPVDDYL
ncbi:AfsR/SARP family transcriptional regulator [Actinoplanes sp. URMC 104]|uniref:AfsR/SARP family transcriptional regulator n=1 Tax=Actinoplanes sp. URMC 104 TaxID=3423409 RepID=UPI003F1AF947